MDETIKLLNERLGIKGSEASLYSPLTLAYIGDAIYEAAIRSVIVGRGNMPVKKLHNAAITYVSAEGQAKIVDAILDELTEKEMAIYKRGKNSKPHSMAKNAEPGVYLKATGFEALVGYLYLNGESERLASIIEKGIRLIEK